MVRIATAAKWPTAIVALADIGLFTNREDFSLVQDETSGTTTLHGDDVSQMAIGMLIAGMSEDGWEVCRVTAVDGALQTVTVVRGLDGTTPVAHKNGETFKAIWPALTVNQMRDEVTALETAIGSTTVLGTGLPTLVPLVDDLYDLGTRSLRWGDIYVSASSLHVINAAGDVNDLYRLGTAGLSGGAGGASALDAFLARQAASTWEATGSVAGSVRYGMSGAGAPYWALRLAAADAQPFLTATTAGFAYGVGGASATDVLLARNASSRLILTGTLAGDIRFGMTGAATPDLSLRVATANAQPDAQLLKDRLNFGPGGASAIDASLVRLLAATLGGPSDAGLSLGSATTRLLNVVANIHYVYGASADANPKWQVDTNGVRFGAGGATATDILVARQAASVLEVTGSLAGSIRYGMSGAATPFLALRAAAADAQPLAALLTDRLALGAGGASAADYSLVRTGANTGTMSGTLRPATTNAYDLGSTTEAWNNLYLNRTAGSVLFMGASGLVTEDNADFFWDNAAKRLGIGTNAPTARLHLLQATAGTPATAFVQHSDNTNAGSDARLILQVAGGVGGDPHIEYVVNGVTTWSLGADNSDSDAFILALSGNPGTNNRFRAATDGSLFSFLSSNAGSVTTGISAANTPFLSLSLIATDANPAARILKDRISFGAGGASAVDYELVRASANSGTLSGHLLPTVNNTYDLGSATFVWRQVYAGGMTTGSIIPSADNTYDLGSASFRWRDIYVAPTSLRVIKAAGDANPSARLGDALLAFGAGGASATDNQLARQAASIVELTGNLAGSVRYGMSGAAAPFLALRLAAADAQPSAALLTDRLQLGAGGASAPDTLFVRSAANTWTWTVTTILPAADNTLVLGSATVRASTVFGNIFDIRNASGDANSIVKLSSAGLAMGPGGASAIDVTLSRTGTQKMGVDQNFTISGTTGLSLLGGSGAIIQRSATATTTQVSAFRVSTDTVDRFLWLADGTHKWGDGTNPVDNILARQAASLLELTGTSAGSVRFGMTGAALPTVALRAAAADANALVSLTSTGINFGPGGATAVDSSLLRQAASVLEHTGSLAGSVRHGMTSAGIPIVSGRLAAADANSAWHLGADVGLSFGAGGATARDIFIERVVPTSNKLVHVGAASAGTTGIWIDTTTPGIILKDSSNNYWRVTIDTAGALVTTSIGASLP